MGLRNWYRRAFEAGLFPRETVLDHSIAMKDFSPAQLAGAFVVACLVSVAVPVDALQLTITVVLVTALFKIRFVALSERQVTVFRRNSLGGFTNLASFAAAAFTSEARDPRWGYVPFRLGDTRYWMRTRSFRRMAQRLAAPTEPRETGSDEDVERPESAPYVDDADVRAAYGPEVVAREVDRVLPVVTHSLFRLRGRGDPWVEIYVCDHRQHPGMAADDESNWRGTGAAQEVAGVGDAAFYTSDDTFFARLGDGWTIQIMGGSRVPEAAPGRRGHFALMRHVLDRLGALPP